MNLPFENDNLDTKPMQLAARRSLQTCVILMMGLLLVALHSPAKSKDALSPERVAIRVPLAEVNPAKPPAEGIIALERQLPEKAKRLDSEAVFFDFGRVAFGNLEFSPPAGFQGTLTVRFGEKLKDGVIDRDPPGTVRFSEIAVEIEPGKTTVLAPPPDERNTQQNGEVRRSGPTPPAVLTPNEWGVVTPFRWVEIEGLPAGLDASEIKLVRRAAFPKHWDENAASFKCSDETLNRVWELCRYSIKATMFAGVYVDGDRERIPYEADAYLNQLSHFYVDHDPSMARDTFDWLIAYPTWPTEWGPQMVFMAHADWMQNGDAEWVAQRYESLKSKTLMERCLSSELVHSNQQQIAWNDIIDWPPSERDGFVRTEVNTVVNAFHLAAVEQMSDLAAAAGLVEDSQRYRAHAESGREVFYAQLFDREKGLFRDGLGVNHHSIHANLFPLAFGLVKEEDKQGIVDWLVERGMRCSTYASQYLLEALFENGAGEAAVELIIAPGERSWRHMLDSDATITWESWNEKVKKNLDWNHAWGAAPANLLPRYVLGVQPLAPGWDRAQIRPCPSGLDFAEGVIPTPHGPVSVEWADGDVFQMTVELPKDMNASVQVPSKPGASSVLVNGKKAEAKLEKGYWLLTEDIKGTVKIEVR
ncbi:MAG: family 78 glycoside hydrolase catalytic domain [Lacipirellulaceae bacterium]